MHYRIALAVSALALAACTEDLAPITKTWTETNAALAAQVAELSKTVGELKAKAGGVAMPSADDKDGLDLKAKLDAAVAGLEAGVADAQKLIATGGTSVNGALAQGKVAGVQAAIDRVKADVAGALGKVKTQLSTVEGLLGDLDKHAAALAEQAKAAAAAAAAALAPPTVDATKAGETDYPNIRFKDGSDELDLDNPATRPSLEALAALLTGCKDIAVELEGHTAKAGDAKKNKELSTKRAQAVAKHLTTVGKVAAGQIKKSVGLGGEKPVVEEPEAGGDAEALKQAQARNERIRVRIVKPCPAPK
ncbi:MAG: OmpA family protein [Myxococcaceae bacterium]|jgi:outer membrane protein OmpA-like peptidoglycan-associated protein|nr:OmpA family protein [Myxococcaceae bacterium]MCA3010907.1 OmpA family protein [Myxococcaceae bacterium]